MLVQKEVSSLELARALKNIDEKELLLVLEPFIKKNRPLLVKVGQHRPFNLFKAIRMRGNGPTASEMVVRDRI